MAQEAKVTKAAAQPLSGLSKEKALKFKEKAAKRGVVRLTDSLSLWAWRALTLVELNT